RFRKLLRSFHPDVHHATPPPPSHVGERRSDRMEHAVDLRPEDTLPGRVVNFRDVLPRIPRSAGIVHQDVDGPEFLSGAEEHLPHVVPFAVSARTTMAREPSASTAFTRRRLFAAEVRRFVPWFRTTSAPSRAKVSAILLPMPSPVLPVTRATRPFCDPDMLREPHSVNNCIEGDPHKSCPLDRARRPKFRTSDFRLIPFIAREV